MYTPAAQYPHVRANNFGYFFRGEPIDYPSRRQSDADLIIAVFGGSVASNVVTAPRGGRTLEEALASRGALRSRRVVVLNFAQGAGKQPQQLLTFAYFLSLGQPFDLVVNVDGFNEVALGYLNNRSDLDYSLPSSQVLLPLMKLTHSHFDAASLHALLTVLRREEWLKECTARREHSSFVLGYYVYKACSAWTQRQLAAARTAFDRHVRQEGVTSPSHSLFALNFRPRWHAHDDDLFRQIAAQWVESSVAMHSLARTSGTRYLHVLHPNQYHSQHRFEAAEQAMVSTLDHDHAYRVGVSQGYPRLLGAVRTLHERGVSFHSAVDLFDQERGPIYADTCCHYNARGETLLAEFIADRVVEVWPPITRSRK